MSFSLSHCNCIGLLPSLNKRRRRRRRRRRGTMNTIASMKETVASIGASAKAGLDKTKATLQEKVEKLTARDQLGKEIAEMKKEEKIMEAELTKQLAFQQNAAVKDAQTTKWTAANGQQSTHVAARRLTTQTPTSLSGQPHGQVIGSHPPVGTNTSGGTTPAPGIDDSYI